MFEFLFNKVAGLQNCCKTYTLYAHLRFYFSLSKTLNYVLKNVEFKLMYTEAYLEPIQTPTIENFCKNG